MIKFKAKSLELKIMVKSLKILLLTCCFALCAGRLAPFCFAEDKIIAVVNNDIITKKDFNDFLNFMRMQMASELSEKEIEAKIVSMKQNLLDRLIEDRLILQEAKREQIIVDNSIIQGKINEIRKKYASEGEFNQALLEQGLTQGDMEKRLSEQLLMYRVIDYKVKSKIKVTPAEVTDFYEKNKEEFKSPEQREFHSLALEDGKLANEIARELSKGKSMEELAKAHSLKVDSLSLSRGGEFRKEVEELLFKLKMNEASAPIDINGISYIFQLYAILPSRQQALNEAQELIYNYVFEQKMQVSLTKWLDEIKNRSYIKIFPD